jgi:hypothetical protein
MDEGFGWLNLKKRDHFEYLDVELGMILNGFKKKSNMFYLR